MAIIATDRVRPPPESEAGFTPMLWHQCVMVVAMVTAGSKKSRRESASRAGFFVSLFCSDDLCDDFGSNLNSRHGYRAIAFVLHFDPPTVFG